MKLGQRVKIKDGKYKNYHGEITAIFSVKKEYGGGIKYTVVAPKFGKGSLNLGSYYFNELEPVEKE